MNLQMYPLSSVNGKWHLAETNIILTTKAEKVEKIHRSKPLKTKMSKTPPEKRWLFSLFLVELKKKGGKWRSLIKTLCKIIKIIKTYWLCEPDADMSLLMKGDIAASNAFGHSSWGKWPHPDIATSLCKWNG